MYQSSPRSIQQLKVNIENAFNSSSSRRTDYVFREVEDSSSMFLGILIYILCSVRYEMQFVLVGYSFRRITLYVNNLSLKQT
jgi:hypothetical protein